MSNKNAYEIRLDVLSMASSLVQERAYRKNDALQQDWHAAARFAEAKQEPAPNYPDPVFPDSEEIVQTAKFLLEFVENGKTAERL